jgi:hypothetical protein
VEGPAPRRIRQRLGYEALLARYRVRRRAERVDSPEVRNARRLLTAARRQPAPDVVYVGDSTAGFSDPTDTDGRSLAVIVSHTLARRGTVTFMINGENYHAELIAAYLRLLLTTDARPVLIVPLWIRGRLVPWMDHPIWGHAAAIRLLDSIGPQTAPRTVRGGFDLPPAAELERFYERRHLTLLGDLTIAEYVEPLRDARRWIEDEAGRSRLSYAYRHTAALKLGSAPLQAVVRLGSVVRQLGCPVVAYQTPVPIDAGVAHFGQQFADIVAANFAVLDASFTEGLGRPVEIIQSGSSFAGAEFADPAGAQEYLTDAGRERLADLIVERVRRELAAR